MDPSEPEEELSMNELTYDVSPHILDIPQHNPFFYPIGFWGWLGWFDPPVFYPL